jgi:hypothetical protein
MSGNGIYTLGPSDQEEPVIVREDEYCPICENHNGHSLSCATFRFNHIEGIVSDRATIDVELVGAGETLLHKRVETDRGWALPGGHTD